MKNYKRIFDSNHGDKPRDIFKDNSLETLSGIHPAPQGRQVFCLRRYKIDIVKKVNEELALFECNKRYKTGDVRKVSVKVYRLIKN
ncbi:MAG: hypothetical protein LR001_05465 [Clostridiales bacterium]|nr:hypothetical protein [Clostridiales bacterium]